LRYPSLRGRAKTVFRRFDRLAIAGTALECLRRKGWRTSALAIYLGIGWLAPITLRPLLRALPLAGFVWLATGGLFYTIGVLCYSLDERLRYVHGVWHLFVLAGSASHYVAILYCLA